MENKTELKKGWVKNISDDERCPGCGGYTELQIEFDGHDEIIVAERCPNGCFSIKFEES